MKQDYQDFEIKLNMKTIMLFEQMADKSFYNMGSDDIPLMVYCSLVINNKQKITYSRFEQILKNEKIAKTLMRKCQEELDFISQFNKKVERPLNIDENMGTPEGETGRLTEIINTLILSNHIDINYVMNDMCIWEIPLLAKTIEDKTKADMVEKRFWAYLNICPHIDSKKVKTPEDLLPFPWEKETKKETTLKFMDDNKEALNKFFKNSKE